MKRDKVRKKLKEFLGYDSYDTSSMIELSQPLELKDIGLRLPKVAPSQVVSLRLPSRLLNELRAMGSEQDIPYQILIKLFLAEAVQKKRKKTA